MEILNILQNMREDSGRCEELSRRRIFLGSTFRHRKQRMHMGRHRMGKLQHGMGRLQQRMGRLRQRTGMRLQHMVQLKIKHRFVQEIITDFSLY